MLTSSDHLGCQLVSLLCICGSYCKLVHLASESLKFFDEEVTRCFSTCIAQHEGQLQPPLLGQ